MYLSSLPEDVLKATAIANDFNYPYFAVSLSLNVLLTSMIVIRLILHRRNIQNAMGASAGAGQLYGAVITILVESSALYAVSFLLFFVPWIAGIWVGGSFGQSSLWLRLVPLSLFPDALQTWDNLI